MYKCPNCGEEIDPNYLRLHKDSNGNKCPKCRYRILFKEVPEVRKLVKAR
ncbi:MAG: DNA-directed RNA polymerase subunit P [Methanobrevibacter sp.]|nr:DNA-directed RNA polymerase subunit P [Methanobrevibacter sp.]